MRPLRYSINVSLDGCCDHRAGTPDEELHRHAVENLERADALLFGRVTYQMMEAAFRGPAPEGARPQWVEPFARTMDAAKKYVVSRTLDHVDWNSELVRGDLGEPVRELKAEPGKGLLVGGVTVPLALAELGLIDEYEFVVQPRLVGHGPTLFAGLSKVIDLRLVGASSQKSKTDLAPRPGPPEFDCAPRAVIAWAHALEVLQHVLRAVRRPDRQPAVVGVLERPASADGDEPRVPVLAQDHRSSLHRDTPAGGLLV